MWSVNWLNEWHCHLLSLNDFVLLVLTAEKQWKIWRRGNFMQQPLPSSREIKTNGNKTSFGNGPSVYILLHIASHCHFYYIPYYIPVLILFFSLASMCAVRSLAFRNPHVSCHHVVLFFSTDSFALLPLIHTYPCGEGEWEKEKEKKTERYILTSS